MRGSGPNGSDGRDDLARELDAHLEIEQEDLRERGMDPGQAASAARRELGNLTHIQEAVHEMRRFAAVERWARDLRFAARSLLRDPAFAAVAVLALGLGIGSASAVFTVVDQALFRFLPVREPRGLESLTWEGRFIGGSTRGYEDSFSYPLFRELERERPAALSGIAARFEDRVAIDAGSGPARGYVELASGEYFSVLGVSAVIGRTIEPGDDEERDGEPWAVLAHDYWQSQFAGDPSILGKTIHINSYPLTVIGVAQRGFNGFEPLRPANAFVPLSMKAAVTPTWDHRDRRDSIWLNVFARLAPDVTADEAETALSGPYVEMLRRDLAAHPRDEKMASRYLQNRLRLADGAQGAGEVRQSAAAPLHVLLGMVGVLVLITCVNVAGLLIIRSAKRERELAVRSSLGASRLAMLRLALSECLVLGAAGLALGLALARMGTQFLVTMIPSGPLGLTIDPSLDWRVAGFTASLALATAVLIGVAPALRSSSPAAERLKSGSASVSASRGHTRLRRALVVTQVGLCLTLLSVAGLFGKSLDKLFGVRPGFAVEHLLSFSVDTSQHGYTPARAHELAMELQRRLERIPGVAAASASQDPILRGANGQSTVKPEGYENREGEDMQSGTNRVLPGWFDSVGVNLLAGRDFTGRDRDDSPEVAIVNNAFATRFFGSPGEAVGRRLGYFGSTTPLPFEIVGVVADHKATDLREDGWPRVYMPLLQAANTGHMAFYLRAVGNPEALAEQARAAVGEIDGSLAVFDVAAVARQAEETHYIERLFARLSAAFAVLALLLAAVGVYGISAFSVTRRTREIGLRMALGARRGGIVRLVLGETLSLAALGAALGAPAALAAGKLFESQLFGVPAVDPLVFGWAAAVLGGVCLLAGGAPARRAAGISPVRALRHE